MRLRVVAILLVLSAVALVAAGCATAAGELTPTVGVEEGTAAPGIVPGETETEGVGTPEVTETAPGAAETESPTAEGTVTGTVTATGTITATTMPTGTPTTGG